jgi:hypothetical protein
LEVVRLDAALGRGTLGKETLKYAPQDPDQAALLADLDPELHGLPIGIPAGDLREGEEHGASGSARASFEAFSKRSR